jgi:L-lysine 6-oxidase
VRLQGGRPDMFENGIWKSGEHGYRPSFETDIKPIFERAAGYRWVAAIPPKPHSFDYERLGNTDPALNEFRKYFLDAIRPPYSDNVIINPASGATMMPDRHAIFPAPAVGGRLLRRCGNAGASSR